MATAFGGSQSPVSNQAPEKYFSDQAWRGMLAEDAQAFKAIAIVLATVITLGFVAILSTVLIVL